MWGDAVSCERAATSQATAYCGINPMTSKFVAQPALHESMSL
jgi:hypothetical protein